MSKQSIKKKTRPLTEGDKALLNQRGSATQFWPEIVNVRGVTVEEKARALAARLAQPECKLPSHVRRKLLLDLVVDITPRDKPVPDTLIALLRDELGLPANHQVGSWPLIAGMHDDRGKPDHEARECASSIDFDYIETHLTHMPLRMLVREVKAKLGRAPDKKSLRKWRARNDYWLYQWEPPTGGGK